MPAIQDILRDRFGLEALRPLQAEIIDRVLGGGHALVVMPTGSGKSLCYQLPALVERERRGGTTLVFSPLIALMEDQVAALRVKGINATYINSTLSKKEREQRQAQLAAGELEIIYATPERMDKPEFVRAIEACPGGVPLLAVDECHCVSKWGHDLRPAYRRVGAFREQLGNPTTIALTATATRAVREDVRGVLGFDESAMPLFSAPVERPNLELTCTPVWDDDEKVEKIRSLSSKMPGTGIVYFALIKDLERYVDRLRRELPDRRVSMYHGRLDPRQKKKVYDDFARATPDENLLLCATNAFGMGVDKPDIRFITHAQVPASVEAYHQEVGRAGRDGAPAVCELLYSQDDLAIQQDFARWQNPSADLVVQVATAIERNHAHKEFDADELRVEVVGKGHAFGMGGQTVEYALIALADLGAIEPASFQDGPLPTYRFVRALDDAELDTGAMEEKRQRDLHRLLDVVKLTQADDIKAYVNAYFEL
ncbi:MAG: RecQ family ATP-dependent DNA helicase [Phycisphaerales bacterium]